MSVSPPGQLPIVPETERVDRKVTGHDRYRTMRHIARMTPAIDRM